MNAVFRILLMVNIAFGLALLVSLYAIMRQAETDIQREKQGVVHMLDALIESHLEQPRLLVRLVSENLRHITLVDHQGPEAVIEGHEAPDWFRQLLHREEGQVHARTIPNGEGGMITLMPDDSDEIDEVWDSTRRLFWLFIGSALLSNLAIYLGVSYGMRPLGHILRALDQIQQGQFKARLGHYSVPEVERLASHFNEMAAALEKSEAENRFLTRTLMEVRDQERAALARELHDDLGQHVTGIRTQAYLLTFEGNRPVAPEVISQRIIDSCNAIHEGFRRLVQDLHPVLLEQLGLRAAIVEMASQFEDHAGIRCQCRIETLPGLLPQQETHLYRLIQEGLNNIARHAGADLAEVDLECRQRRLWLTIRDNGCGIPDTPVLGMGLRSMRERCRLLGAEFRIAARRSGGTRVTIELPFSGGTGHENSAG